MMSLAQFAFEDTHGCTPACTNAHTHAYTSHKPRTQDLRLHLRSQQYGTYTVGTLAPGACACTSLLKCAPSLACSCACISTWCALQLALRRCQVGPRLAVACLEFCGMLTCANTVHSSPWASRDSSSHRSSATWSMWSMCCYKLNITNNIRYIESDIRAYAPQLLLLGNGTLSPPPCAEGQAASHALQLAAAIMRTLAAAAAAMDPVDGAGRGDRGMAVGKGGGADKASKALEVGLAGGVCVQVRMRHVPCAQCFTVVVMLVANSSSTCQALLPPPLYQCSTPPPQPLHLNPVSMSKILQMCAMTLMLLLDACGRPAALSDHRAGAQGVMPEAEQPAPDHQRLQQLQVGLMTRDRLRYSIVTRVLHFKKNILQHSIHTLRRQHFMACR